MTLSVFRSLSTHLGRVYWFLTGKLILQHTLNPLCSSFLVSYAFITYCIAYILGPYSQGIIWVCNYAVNIMRWDQIIRIPFLSSSSSRGWTIYWLSVVKSLSAKITTSSVDTDKSWIFSPPLWMSHPWWPYLNTMILHFDASLSKTLNWSRQLKNMRGYWVGM